MPPSTAHPILLSMRKIRDAGTTIDRPDLESPLDSSQFNPSTASMAPAITRQLSGGECDLGHGQMLKSESSGEFFGQATDHERVGIGGHRNR